MKNYKIALLAIIMTALLAACNNDNNKADGYGNFEATEITVSAENSGRLMAFNVEEGTELAPDQFLGYIDTVPLALKKEQLLVQKEVIRAKSKGVLSQIDVLQAKLETAKTNRARIKNLIEDNAGTQKQLDDVEGEISVLESNIGSIKVQNAPVVNEIKSIDVQLQQLEDQISKSKIINPIQGTVLTKYMEQDEIVTFGRPLYKIADLSVMELRAYISETQLAQVAIGDSVSVKIDYGEDMKSYDGTISWVASESEFTPKIIQTKEERVALVYAVKIRVINDGSLKIGMPAEMWLTHNTTEY